MTREKMQDILGSATGCGVQHDGWTCGTCFFAINEELDNSDWQNILLLRGDYTEDELDNLPKDRKKSIEKICNLIKGE